MTRLQRLELNWIGKEKRSKLEPRILIEDRTLSFHAATRREGDIFDNKLIRGDNLLGLKALESDFLGEVKCAYIDPPFNTQQAFEHYDDGVEHSIWLTLMRDRLDVIRRLLSPDGSIFVHIDDNELAYLIVLLDEIFGRANRINVVTFKQSSASGPKALNPGLVTTSNYLLIYAKDRSQWRPNRVYVATSRDDRYSRFVVNIEDDFSHWKLIGLREAFLHSAKLADWKAAKTAYGAKLEARITEFVLKNANRVVRTARVAAKDVNGSARDALQVSIEKRDEVQCSPREDKDDYYFLNGEQLIFYITKTRVIDGVLSTVSPLTNLWDDLLSNNLHKEGGVTFPNGKKPEALIKRCLELTTSRGDLVLDSFAGSGTTGAVAHKMGRRWLMIEQGDHCETHIVPRLKRAIEGEDDSGVTEAVGWKGGGGFQYFRLASSLLQKDRFGNWVIAPTYNPVMLAEAVCKLMGFTFAPSSDPAEYWRHGSSTELDFIYITTQALTYDALKSISEDVGPRRTLLVCCKAFNADEAVFPNLTLRKIPKAVLSKCDWGKVDEYNLAVQALPPAEDEDAKSKALAPTSATKPRRSNSTTSPSLFDHPEEQDPT